MRMTQVLSKIFNFGDVWRLWFSLAMNKLYSYSCRPVRPINSKLWPQNGWNELRVLECSDSGSLGEAARYIPMLHQIVPIFKAILTFDGPPMARIKVLWLWVMCEATKNDHNTGTESLQSP